MNLNAVKHEIDYFLINLMNNNNNNNNNNIKIIIN